MEEEYEGKEAEGKDGADEKDESGPIVRAPPRRGRRERKEDKEEESTEVVSAPSQQTAVDPGPRPGRRRRAGQDDGGWMSVEPEAKPRLSIDRMEDVAESISVKRNKHNDDNDELMLIPDLDQDGVDEDKRVAHAPKNVGRRIPTLTELNDDVKTVISSNELGYDLAVLLNSLVPAEFLSETDSQWTFDSLLQEVTEEFQKDSKLSNPLAPAR